MGIFMSFVLDYGAAYGLFKAVRTSDIQAVNRLLSRMKGIHLLKYRVLGSRDTIWHVAASIGNVEVLKALLARGLAAGLQQDRVPELLGRRNSKGQTPLIVAAWHNHLAAVRWLMQQGVDGSVADGGGNRTALHYAVLRGSNDTVLELLNGFPAAEVHRYLEAITITGLTPLHFAAALNKASTAQVLLQRGADLLAATTVPNSYELVSCAQRSTPLHVAALQGHTEVTLALMRHYYDCMNTSLTGADPRRRLNARGKLPYQVAAGTNSGMLAELLHPDTNLQGLFAALGAAPGSRHPSVGGTVSGVPRLGRIAADVVRQQLLADIQAAESLITSSGHQDDDSGGALEPCRQQQQPRHEPAGADLPVCSAGRFDRTSGGVRARMPPSQFVRMSEGWKEPGESEFTKQALHRVVPCTICLEDSQCLVAVSCHHRLCAGCARDITLRAPSMPLVCPVCRCMVSHWAVAEA